MGKLVKFVSKRRGRPRKARPVATKALKRAIQKEIHKDVETKYVDFTISVSGGSIGPYLVDTTAEVVTGVLAGGGSSSANAIGLMPYIVQGTTQQQRIGDELRVKRLNLTFRATAFSPTVTGVVYIVRYPQTDGRLPTIGNIWNQVADIATAQRNPDYMNDYHILGKIMLLPDRGVALNRIYSWSKSYKGAGLKVEYSATNAAKEDVEFNNIFLIAQANGGDDTILISNGNCRVTYTDS